MALRRKIDGIDVIASENEVWFLQDGKMCWTTLEEVWSESLRLGEMLRQRGYTIQTQRFLKKLRALILALSKPN
jgi:hypothetical protein